MRRIGDTPTRRRFYELPIGTRHVLVEWRLFDSFRAARRQFWSTPCLYTFADPSNRQGDYVGKTATGLGLRYPSEPERSRGALVFVAALEPPYLEFAEHMTIFYHCPPVNKRGRGTLPLPHIPILHRFEGVDSWWGCGTTRTIGRCYEGPLFLRPGNIREAGTGRIIA